MKIYKINYRYHTIEVDDEEGESLDDAIINFVMGITEKYSDYLDFEEIKNDEEKTGDKK